MSNKELNRNVKIYPWYRAFSYDFVFLWTISILYLTEVKSFSYSQAILLDSIFMLTCFALQIPISKIINKLGRTTSTQLASLCSILFVLIYLLAGNFYWFILANVLHGIGTAVRNITDVEILSLSLKKLNRKKDFARLEGRGLFGYYIFEGLSAIVAGYLYEFVSPYAPVIGTGICAIILLVLSFVLKDPIDEADEECIKQREIKQKANSPSYKTLLKRPFVFWLVIFAFSFYGIINIHSLLAKVYYQSIETPAYLFGYIFCLFKLLTAVASKYSFKYELKRGVKTLIIFSGIALLSYFSCGILYLISPTGILSVVLVSIMISLQHIGKSVYRITIRDYITSGVSKHALTKTLNLYSMAESLGYTIVTLFASLIMSLSNNYATTNLAIVGLVALPLGLSAVMFIRSLIKVYTARCTIVRKNLCD